MKKITLGIITVCLLFTTIPTPLIAKTQHQEAWTAASKSKESENANALLSRLNEIKELDKSKLSSPQKKELRTEVLSIREKLKAISGGVYISTGAIIIIILLLIILL